MDDYTNSALGLVNQIGDAWDPNKFLLKKSVGIQLRITGFFFYNFPTAIELEFHQPITKFYNEGISHGPDKESSNRKTYFKILFDFLTFYYFSK